VFPAARWGDPITHDMNVPCGVIAPPVSGPAPGGMVMIEKMPAAYVTSSVACTGVISAGLIHPPPPGPPLPILKGSTSVFVNKLPAARWSPSGDLGACGVFLGLPALAGTRRVFIGG